MLTQSNMQPARSLVLACDKLLLFILSLQTPNSPGDMRMLHTQAQAQIMEMQQRAKAAGIDSHTTYWATLALVAFVDETISVAVWANRANWPFLQYFYFNTHRAGEQFFENLQQIRGSGYDPAIWRNPAKAGLLEVYYLSLLLGFRGEWAFSTAQQFQRAMDAIERHICSKPVGPLSPNITPKPYDDPVRSAGSRWMWGAIALQLALMILLLLIFMYRPGFA